MPHFIPGLSVRSEPLLFPCPFSFFQQQQKARSLKFSCSCPFSFVICNVLLLHVALVDGTFKYTQQGPCQSHLDFPLPSIPSCCGGLEQCGV